MTIDERLEFLVQSTESLHATVHEMTGQIQEMTGQIQEMTGQIQEMTGQLHQLTGHVGTLVEAMKIAGQNIQGLTKIAQRHEDRLDALDGGAGGSADS